MNEENNSQRENKMEPNVERNYPAHPFWVMMDALHFGHIVEINGQEYTYADMKQMSAFDAMMLADNLTDEQVAHLKTLTKK